jgi:hypothetical protein
VSGLLPGAYEVSFGFGTHREKAMVTVGAGPARLDYQVAREPIEAEQTFRRRVGECRCNHPAFGE